ncbi:MAG TPA: hypothetical protein VIH87_04260 [Methylocella sp.]
MERPSSLGFGLGLRPKYMRLTAPWDERRDAIDLARVELALSVAFDAADGSGIDYRLSR